jgi:hypothetical protein
MMIRRFVSTACTALISSSALIACADTTGGDAGTGPGVGGKADEGASDTCTTTWSTWFLERFAPMGCTEGPACIGRADARTRPTCDGGVPRDTWKLGFTKHVVTPWLQRVAQARTAFATPGAPGHENAAIYAAATMPTAAEQAAVDALLTVPVLKSAYDYQLGFEEFAFWIEDFASPLRSTNNAFVGGRLLCVDVDLAQCSAEPPLWLNAGEKAFLAMAARLVPDASTDGDFATWVGSYFDFLAAGNEIGGTEFLFPMSDMEPALFAYEHAFFQYLLSLAPEAIGERDSLAWFDHYTAIVLGTDLGQPNAIERLVLFEASRPPVLVGLPAYTSFLGKDGGLSGLALFEADDTDRVSLILGAKPCARSETELEAMQAVHRTYRGIAKAEAAPERCAD